LFVVHWHPNKAQQMVKVKLGACRSGGIGVGGRQVMTECLWVAKEPDPETSECEGSIECGMRAHICSN